MKKWWIVEVAPKWRIKGEQKHDPLETFLVILGCIGVAILQMNVTGPWSLGYWF